MVYLIKTKTAFERVKKSHWLNRLYCENCETPADRICCEIRSCLRTFYQTVSDWQRCCRTVRKTGMYRLLSHLDEVLVKMLSKVFYR